MRKRRLIAKVMPIIKTDVHAPIFCFPNVKVSWYALASANDKVSVDRRPLILPTYCIVPVRGEFIEEETMILQIQRTSHPQT